MARKRNASNAVRRQQRIWLLVVVVPAVLTTGCTASSIPTIAVYESSGTGGDSAQLEGELRLTQTSCVIVETATGETFVPMFPADEVETGGTGGLFGYQEADYSAGDPIELRGGIAGDDSVIPDACRGAGTAWMVAQAD